MMERFCNNCPRRMERKKGGVCREFCVLADSQELPVSCQEEPVIEQKFEDELDADYQEARRILDQPGGMTQQDVERVMRRILMHKAALFSINETWEAAKKREQTQIDKMIRFYGPAIKTWLQATLEVQNKGKKKPTKSVITPYGVLKHTSSGGRHKIEDEAQVIQWITEGSAEDPSLKDLLNVTTKVNARELISRIGSTGEVVPGVGFIEKFDKPSIALVQFGSISLDSSPGEEAGTEE